MSLRRIARLIIATAIAALGLLSAGNAQAAAYHVSNCSDSIPPQEGSFRYYLDLANATPGWDSISLDEKFGGCIMTPVAPFVISEALSVYAGDATAMRLRMVTDGQLDDMTLIQLDKAEVQLNGLEMFGQPTQRGIYVSDGSKLTFQRGRIHGFEHPTALADPPHIAGEIGGGILSHGALAVQFSYVQHCAADLGGGIAFIPTGAVQAFSFSSSIADNNVSTYEGGAMLLLGSSSSTKLFTLNRANVFDNRAGGEGGAIYAFAGHTKIGNSTFTGNKTYSLGGAIYQYGGELDVEFSTLADNTSWGDYGHELRTEDTVVRLNSSIFGYSSTWTGGSSMACYLSAPPALSVRNVLQELSCSWGSTGNTIGADMGLSGPALYLPLGSAYGPPYAFLWLFGLDASGPAHNLGDPALCGSGTYTTDERGTPRSSICDSGAFEWN